VSTGATGAARPPNDPGVDARIEGNQSLDKNQDYEDTEKVKNSKSISPFASATFLMPESKGYKYSEKEFKLVELIEEKNGQVQEDNLE